MSVPVITVRPAFVAIVVAFMFAAPANVYAKIVAKIDLSSQRMYVYVNGKARYKWKISTARRGYRTPIGTYRPGRMHRTYYSRKYYNSPMPHSIFFRGGYAIHGTNAIRNLGRPASHGCVRLHPANARTLFNLVRAHGRAKTRLRVQR